MGVSPLEQGDPWLNRVLGIPVVPATKRDYYPFSKSTALVYRLKLASAMLLIATSAIWRPDLRLPLLLNCWLLFLTFEATHRNYPWREPLTAWLWRVRLALPHSETLLCAALLLLCSQAWVGLAPMPHPRVAALVCWSCGLLAWPIVRESRRRKEIKETDYDKFSTIRPRVLTLPRPLVLVLQSPSLLVPLVIGVSAPFTAPLLPRWAAACVGALVLALFCCHSLPRSIWTARDEWAGQEDGHARKIAYELSRLQFFLRRLGQPRDGTTFFDQTSVQFPLLRREVAILLRNSRTRDDERVQQLQEPLADPEMRQLVKTLERFGPYTTRCCIS